MKSLTRVRFWLFLATGLAVPFHAFPVRRVAGRPLDSATILAGLFVLACAIAALGSRLTLRRSETLFLLAALTVPLLVLIPPRPERFDLTSFLVSWLHWVLVVLFFAGALLLELSAAERRRLVLANLALGTLVALFALYQVVGFSRGWPAAGVRPFPFQRAAFRMVSVGASSPGGSYVRPTSIFLEPAWMGGYLAGILALALSLGRASTRRRGETVVLSAAVAVILAAILASVSWGPYADAGAVLLAAVVGGLLARGTRRAAGRATLVGAAILAAVVFATPPGRSVAQAVAARWRMLISTPLEAPESSPQIKDSSWLRVRNVERNARLWRAHPFGGIGLGQFGRYVPPVGDAPPRKGAPRGSWCGWLAIGAETGVLGPVVLAAAIGLVLARWRRLSPDSVSRSAVPLLAILAAVQQLHTGSYIDLWWWYPLSLAAALSGSSR